MKFACTSLLFSWLATVATPIPIHIDLALDRKGNETYFTLTGPDGIIDDVPLGEFTANNPGAGLYPFFYDVAPGTYTLEMRDAGGDGMCCEHGDGGYIIYQEGRGGGVLGYCDGKFGDYVRSSFTVMRSDLTYSIARARAKAAGEDDTEDEKSAEQQEKFSEKWNEFKDEGDEFFEKDDASAKNGANEEQPADEGATPQSKSDHLPSGGDGLPGKSGAGGQGRNAAGGQGKSGAAGKTAASKTFDKEWAKFRGADPLPDLGETDEVPGDKDEGRYLRAPTRRFNL